MRLRNPLQTLAQISSVVARLVDQLVGVDASENRARHRRSERVTAEGAAVAARRERCLQVFLRQHGADRHAAAEALRERDRIGHDLGVLETQEATGAANARLNFVAEQERAARLSELAQAAQKAGR